jgi:hypothetical protein
MIDLSQFNPAFLLWAAESAPVWLQASEDAATAEQAVQTAGGPPSAYLKAAEAPAEAVAATLDTCPMLVSNSPHASVDRPTAEAKFKAAATANKLGDGTILKGILGAIQAAGGVKGILSIVTTIMGLFGKGTLGAGS